MKIFNYCHRQKWVRKIGFRVVGKDEFGKDWRAEAHPECVIIFTHGFALRVIAKAFLHMSDEEFRYLSNPPNCYVATVNITKSGIVLKEPLPKIKSKI